MAGRLREEARLRSLLAQASARIMAEEGVRDFLVAKRKAAQRLGVTARALMPSNQEIEAALSEYQRLFLAETHNDHVQHLRAAAFEAMRFFERFRPRLVGSVLNGTAGPDADIQLHVFADTVEDVQMFLMERHVPFETGARRLRSGAGEPVSFPTFAFGAGDVNVDVTVFPPTAEREAPRSPVDGKPMRRAGLREVRELLDERAAEPLSAIR
ncbi:hypothetical protein [Plasticicumulans acidivorans]|uniref:Nucleotidyltransferase-like protein n=1 Tax=Plasticicumulans acidivorans TaxID=886464 RepID=A0A317MQ42_9GAMM|nr:hypothetical protein [Plasticicumulans acidivorans]PWV58693.1 hypothetical protein C7443_11419 [Plasticicumulans acidivorans]